MEKKLFTAIARFQNECPVILKETQAYGYVYADLPKVLDIAKPFLAGYNLGFTQRFEYLPDVDKSVLKTIVFHAETGEQIESTIRINENVELKGMNYFQMFGAATTYIRRYQLAALLGIVTDKDTDANGEQDKKAIPKPKETKQAPLKPTMTTELFDRITKLMDGSFPVTSNKFTYNSRQDVFDTFTKYYDMTAEELQILKSKL